MKQTVPLTIALSKGRIYKQTLPLLAKAGIEPLDDPETSRKLILNTNHEQIKFLVIRATDVPTFVQHGVADLGVTGKDVLLEGDYDALYEPLDLQIAKCRLMVAGRPDSPTSGELLRIATKYVRSAQAYFTARGQQVKIIKLYGAMELAPLVGLADLIVDLVESGSTLKANGLVPLEHIVDISSRLVVNRASWKQKHQPIQALLHTLEKAVNDNNLDQ